MAVVTRTSFSLAAALLLLAAPAKAADLGRNLAGEACQSASAPAPGELAAITCGSSTEAAGHAYVTALPSADQRTEIARLIALQAGEASCGDPEWFGETALRICTLKSNGWPRVTIGRASAGMLYEAEGAPSSLPALQAAIAAASNMRVAAADEAAMERSLQAKLSPGILHASASDYSGYQKSIEAGRLAGAADNYAAAETNYRNTLAIEERLFGPASTVVGQTLIELALQVSNQGRFAEAAALFHRAGPIIEASSDNGARARFDSYQALDAANQRHYQDAMNFARQATAARRAEIAAAKQTAAAADPSGGTAIATVSQGELAHDLRIEAAMALRLGDVASARASAEEALWIVSEEPGLPLWWRADTVALMGEINERQGRVVAAEHDLRDARDLDTKLFGDTAPTALADIRLAEFYGRQQVYGPAMDGFRLAFAIAAKDPVTRKQIYPDDIVQFIAADLGNAANGAARDAEIFRNSQFASSGVADQTIARVAARQAAGNSALADLIAQAQSAARERDRTRVELAAEIARPSDDRDTNKEQELTAKLQLASANSDQLAARVRQSFPDYAALAEPGPAELARVQQSLGANDAMVIYIIGETSSFALVVRQSGFAAVPLAIGADALQASVSDLRTAFVPALGKLPQFSLKNAYALQESLIAPLAGQLNGADHLIVVPQGALSSLPLSLLVTSDPGESHDYTNAAWLIRRYAISEVPSARAFVTLQDEAAHHASAPRAFLGVGAPTFQGAQGAAGQKALADLSGACREAGPTPAELLRALPPLPGTAAEVDTVGKRIGGAAANILTGALATETNLRAQPLDQYAVLYFATHGILPGEIHCESEPSLALSPPAQPAQSTQSDGMLTASEIAALRLNADLVVLSACNTAESTDGLGGGALEGLSDAFFAAGARAVLASHWEVPSVATASLMTGIFTGGRRDLAEALRQSQLALIGQAATAHPFNWAAFTIIGDGETLTGGTLRSAQLTGQP